MIPLFQEFIEAKPLYYKEIDYERIHLAYASLKTEIRHPKTVHIVGTNGKGSTGRILAHLAHKSGLKVGHFSSPHILKFNERIWLNGEDSSDEVLERSHQRLYKILGKETCECLSYFEYTTLLALVVFEDLDLVVLEAGLGGEYDATNVCDKVLSIITPIGIDHQAFLGETIEEIAGTKIRSIQKQVLVGPQVYDEVIEVARKIADEKGALLYVFSSSQKLVELKKIAKEKGWAEYLVDNASVALQALDILAIAHRVDDLRSLELFGRFYALRENVRIDVGHNPLAAGAIEKALDDKVVLIYNSLDDKDYEAVLEILKPKVKRVEIIPIHSQRATTLSEIEKALEKVGIKYSYFEDKIDKDEQYLVFGSFYVVEEFLKRFHVPK
ncbi:bifunctional folylpolyglutamate synthase/dihydrofolate synthase [Sulfurovum sp.]|uniref:bifunctional folylpolyglutamate synthase/dihydrofolate synthase n=1 Tax=Sulfurovum sp. TaxID=1969726 RepID=UPI002867CD49|nr:bifunctional folylpolyglutamate synthase/dihydrofolate synthase [Sulfurovum sp.]